MDRTLRLTIATLLGTTAVAPVALAQSAPAAPSSGQCDTTPFIPITGQVGPDGAWHPSRAPQTAAPRRAPCPPPAPPPSTPTAPPGDTAGNAPASPGGTDATPPSNGAGGTTGAPVTAGTAGAASATPPPATSAATASTTPEDAARATSTAGATGVAATGVASTTSATSATTATNTATRGAPAGAATPAVTSSPASARTAATGFTPVEVRTLPPATATSAPAARAVPPPATRPVPPPAARGGGPWSYRYVRPRYVRGVYVYPAPVYRTAVVVPRRPYVPIAQVVIGGAFGGGNLARENVTTDVGLAWSGTLGVALADVISLEARYDGGWMRFRADQGLPEGSGVLASGGAGLLRLAIPVPLLRPFVQAGVGFYHFDLKGGGTPDVLANVSRNIGQVPVGGGLELRLHRAVGLTGEFMYRFVFDATGFEQPAQTWGNLWTATGGVRFYL